MIAINNRLGILDQYGAPYPKSNGKPRQDLLDVAASSHKVRATYDGASDRIDDRRYWAHTDGLDANSANSPGVRKKLRDRSRYEVGSNGHYAGIINTHVNMVVGVGPSLRMLTGNQELNRAIESAWYRWWQSAGMRRKLWCMAHARTQDGESIGIMVNNPATRNRVQLDVDLIEAEQCQSPFFDLSQVDDGIHKDGFGNRTSYDILPEHPGSGVTFSTTDPVRVPAEQVLHWYKLQRPGQDRGTPDLTSTLNLGAGIRRWLEAVLTNQEQCAAFTTMLETPLPANGEAEDLQPFSTMDIVRGMMALLPTGMKATQLESKHPNAAFADFFRTMISQMARPLGMPYNAAAADSSTYSFASGKLDTLCYRAAIDVERHDCNDLVLDPLFATWFHEWTIIEQLRDASLSHQWDWPAHPVIDAVAEAVAVDKRLRNGTETLRRVYADAGRDYEDEVQMSSEDLGITPEQVRLANFMAIYGPEAAVALGLVKAPATSQAPATPQRTLVASNGGPLDEEEDDDDED